MHSCCNSGITDGCLHVEKNCLYINTDSTGKQEHIKLCYSYENYVNVPI